MDCHNIYVCEVPKLASSSSELLGQNDAQGKQLPLTLSNHWEIFNHVEPSAPAYSDTCTHITT